MATPTASRLTTDPSRPESGGDGPSAAGGPVVVIVNDDPAQLRLTSAVLHKSGFTVLPYRSAEDALHVMCERGGVDLILTDLHMRGIDGWRFCQLLRSPEYRAFNDIPILVVSATYSGADAEQVTAQLGANAFMPAPYDPESLVAFVQDLLHGRQPHERPRALIVDDDAECAKALREALRARGYAVLTATTLDRGRQLLDMFLPHVATLRHRRPDFPAEDLLEAVKQPGSPCVAIVVTSDPDPHAALALTRLGADGFVREPLTPDFVVDLCEKARRQRALLRIEELLEQRTRELQQSEARFRTLFETFPEIVIVHDLAGHILQMNPAAAKRLEYRAESLVGRTLGDISGPGVPGPAAPSLGPVIDEGPGFEATYVTQSGRRIPVEVHETPIAFNGQPASLSVARDISARKEFERQRADFISMMAHDIRNPLGVIIGYTEMLRELGTLSHDQEDLLERIDMNAQAVVSLLSNYLDLSRIEAQSLNIAKRPVQLSDIVNRVAQRYESHARHRGIALDVVGEAEPPLAGGDPLALERVFANLIHNAINFTNDGGRVTVNVATAPSEVRVTVSDTGPGIAAEDMPVIFERFRLLNTSGFGVGTGLGLFIAKSLVEAQGGRIDVSSIPGAGSSFAVTLPALESLHEEAVPEPVQATA